MTQKGGLKLMSRARNKPMCPFTKGWMETISNKTWCCVVIPWLRQYFPESVDDVKYTMQQYRKWGYSDIKAKRLSIPRWFAMNDGSMDGEFPLTDLELWLSDPQAKSTGKEFRAAYKRDKDLERRGVVPMTPPQRLVTYKHDDETVESMLWWIAANIDCRHLDAKNCPNSCASAMMNFLRHAGNRQRAVFWNTWFAWLRARALETMTNRERTRGKRSMNPSSGNVGVTEYGSAEVENFVDAAGFKRDDAVERILDMLGETDAAQELRQSRVNGKTPGARAKKE